MKEVLKQHGMETWVALMTFDAGGFLGITYNQVVWVEDRNNLSTLLHETVHTLQWYHYAKTGFLKRYLQGFGAAIAVGFKKYGPDPTKWKPAQELAVYESNPAEVRACHFQRSFHDAVNTALASSLGKQTSNYTLNNMKSTGKTLRTAHDVAQLVTAQPSLNIDIAGAVQGMG
jgi:hypothetical protein